MRIGQASFLSAQKRFEDARQAYDELIKAYPDYPNIHDAFGRSLLDPSDTEAAVAEFKRQINNPNGVVSRLQIAAARYKIDSLGGLP
jgi:tetratricopeptide (TPR) repeat protein